MIEYATKAPFSRYVARLLKSGYNALKIITNALGFSDSVAKGDRVVEGLAGGRTLIAKLKPPAKLGRME